jgi:ribosomal protein S18
MTAEYSHRKKVRKTRREKRRKYDEKERDPKIDYKDLDDRLRREKDD